MGLINIYDTVSNDITAIKANGRLKNILTDIDFSHSLVLKAGEKLSGDYEVQPEDVIYIRKIPGFTAVMAGIASAFAVIAVGVGVGSAIYAKRASDEAKAEMEKAQRNAENMAAAVQQLPFIRGAKNRKALGEVVQFIMGSVYNTPYNVTDGFYTIDGADGINSYYNAVFSAGYGNQKITQLKTLLIMITEFQVFSLSILIPSIMIRAIQIWLRSASLAILSQLQMEIRK